MGFFTFIWSDFNFTLLSYSCVVFLVVNEIHYLNEVKFVCTSFVEKKPAVADVTLFLINSLNSVQFSNQEKRVSKVSLCLSLLHIFMCVRVKERLIILFSFLRALFLWWHALPLLLIYCLMDHLIENKFIMV